jgi:hypothetical protein
MKLYKKLGLLPKYKINKLSKGNWVIEIIIFFLSSFHYKADCLHPSEGESFNFSFFLFHENFLKELVIYEWESGLK